MTRTKALAGVLVIAAAVIAGSTSPAPAAPAPTLRELVGQRFVISFAGTSPSEALLARVRRGEIGGVILFGPNVARASQVRGLTQALHGAAREAGRPRLLVVTDQEGGAIRRFRWAPPLPSADLIGAMSPPEIRAFGRRTAASLRGLGVDVDLAPVADTPRVEGAFIEAQRRAFSRDPDRVAGAAVAFARGLADGDVLATAKHFPGLGGAVGNTDFVPVTVGGGSAGARADLVPFRRLVESGVPLVMLSNAVYPAYGSTPALLAPAVHSLLRETLGFDGVTITDALEPVARTRGIALSTLAVRTARAGTDLLLFAGGEGASADAFRRVLAAAREGELSRVALERSYRRIVAMKAAIK
ncbi:MAG: glycoside hydrolase family 3 N-terminal domain-containing protein [Gaiellales bacterium]